MGLGVGRPEASGWSLSLAGWGPSRQCSASLSQIGVPMAAPNQLCTSCETPLPGDAAYCPQCGIASPTEINQETGEVRTPRQQDADEAEYRERLQRALGEDYELRDLIGQGGFGVVYVAWDVKLERPVVVKALRHDLFATSQVLERFEREAKAVAKLPHPNILPVYFVGQAEGIAFMVMPKVEGESLRSHLDRERQLSVDEAVRIASEVTAALQVAHDAGIIHRDVKPENILLEGKERRVLLMDFGIAKAAESAEVALTGTGTLVGTPLYMSPEQASGERRIDHRSDIYSLGCVLYEMLAGDPPFTGSNTQAIIVRHISEAPPSLEVVRPGLSENMYQAVSKALAKVPADRFNSVAELASALTASAHAPTWRAKVWRPIGRFRLRPATGILLVGLVAAVLWLVSLAVEKRERRQVAEQWYADAVAYMQAEDYWSAGAAICDALTVYPEDDSGWATPSNCTVFDYWPDEDWSILDASDHVKDALDSVVAVRRWLSGGLLHPQTHRMHRTATDSQQLSVTIRKSGAASFSVGVFGENGLPERVANILSRIFGPYGRRRRSSTAAGLIFGGSGNIPQQRITMNHDSSLINDVLRDFVVGDVRRFILPPEVERMRVTAHFTDKQWEQALQELLGTYGLYGRIESPAVIRIFSR